MLCTLLTMSSCHIRACHNFQQCTVVLYEVFFIVVTLVYTADSQFLSYCYLIIFTLFLCFLYVCYVLIKDHSILHKEKSTF